MARGVLMERQGLSPAAAIRQLADMAAAAGIPVTEMAAAVLRQEPPSGPGRCRAAAAVRHRSGLRRPGDRSGGAARRGGVA